MGSGENGLNKVVDVLLKRSFSRQQPRQVDLGDHFAFATFAIFRVDFLRFDQMPRLESVIGIERLRGRMRRRSSSSVSETLRSAQVGERGVPRVVNVVAAGSHRRRHRPTGRRIHRRRVVVPRRSVAVVIVPMVMTVVMSVEIVADPVAGRRKGAQRSVVSGRQRGKIERLFRHDRQESAVHDAWEEEEEEEGFITGGRRNGYWSCGW